MSGQSTARARPFDARLATLPEIAGVPMHYRPGVDGRELVVVFSPTRRFVLYRFGFSRDTLFVADETGLYYLTVVTRLAEGLIALIGQGGYDRVLFTGSSKGAFGALLTARVCAGLRPDIVFRALAFSPQVRLHPANPALYFPSYQRLRSHARKSASFALQLRRFGDVSLIGDAPNVAATVVYGEGNATDRAEAARFRGPNVALRALEASAHGTMLYFLLAGRPVGYVRERIVKLYERGRRRGQEEDRDLYASRPVDPEKMVQEIVAASAVVPALDDLFGEALAAVPVDASAGGHVAARMRRATRLARLALAEVLPSAKPREPRAIDPAR